METAAATISKLDGVVLRPAGALDQALLLQIYSGTREEELAQVNWNDAQKAAFLQMQFKAQSQHYATHYPNASHDIILHRAEPAGRLYVDREPRQIHIIDIALLPSHRGRGIGSALLNSILEEAGGSHRSVQIYVEKFNRAQTLYRRLGFVQIADQGIYLLMEWKPALNEE